jgi:choline monooxygenase
MNTSRIIPIDETRTELRYEFYFADRSPALLEKHRATIETNCAIVREDFGICEEVQQNLKAGIYRDGPLSPRHEDGVQYFQEMVRQSLGRND